MISFNLLLEILRRESVLKECHSLKFQETVQIKIATKMETWSSTREENVAKGEEDDSWLSVQKRKIFFLVHL